MERDTELARFRALDRFGSLAEAVLAARRAHGAGRVAVEDIAGTALTYGRLTLAAAVLERAFRARFASGERVGVLLPAAPGAVAVLLGFWRSGRVPAMLNPTVGPGPVLAALRVAGCGSVLSSRVFVEKAELGALVEEMVAAGFAMVWTEDLRRSAGAFDKLAAAVAGRFAPRDVTRASEAAVLFTSGTEGAPKGVVLTHGNILANIAQLRARAPIGPEDRAVSALPLFHSFGLTAGVALMLATGIRTGLHPSPLHYRVIPELVRRLEATILIGTDTFLAGWGRRATAAQLGSLRAVVAGGEPVKATTRALWTGSFGVPVLEGYGATETGPVLALNDYADPRPGTVGRLLPGIEYRLEPVPGIDGERLFVRGPNVMAGYLRLGGEGAVEPPEDGWYDTGDVVRMGPEGHVTIVGRLRRFAKVGGEMVSLARVEALAADVWPDEPLGAAALPCPRKGQKVVLAIAHPGARLEDLRAHAREAGVAEIQLPAELRVLAEIPVLASGKTDFPRLQALLEAE
ncbi:AMP-binding protein [Amaricoccus solimangrovi]|uniref:AMP-binding protein n=1 Tax=Amaricoccus solimangrovi TaxID=2589815 RepID=A0A501WTB6_9RHOB|nr:AMP-binding protein [Amaricoccus solimangrovi]TPE51344.1 AMP-binding protein [Amaricoccus solimangrovi]